MLYLLQGGYIGIKIMHVSILQASSMGIWKAKDVTSTVRSFLGHLGTARLWTSYSLMGARGKKAFQNLNIYTLVKGDKICDLMFNSHTQKCLSDNFHRHFVHFLGASVVQW